jgi:pilus assembly protein CpaF
VIKESVNDISTKVKISPDIERDTDKMTDEEKQIENLLKGSFLGHYLNEDRITDISYNGTTMWVQDNKYGRYIPDEQPEYDDVFRLGKQIADIQGKEWTNSDPRLNTELANFRVNFIHDTISPNGCTFSIRVSKPQLATNDLTDFANDDVAKLLSVLILADSNLIIAGRTGSGKTELQKLLVNFIPDHKKITLIEDTMDSHIKALYPEKDINSWRTLTEDGRENKVDYNDLIKEGLRNNPDWLIVAETRGSEAYDMLVSALTDHSIITTIHAKGASVIPSRLLSMIGQKYQTNEILLGKDIVNTLRFGIYITMEYDKEEGYKRFIREVVEYTDFTDKGVECIPLFRLNKVFDDVTNQYKEVVTLNKLSDYTIQDLEYRELVHLVPKAFLKGE